MGTTIYKCLNCAAGIHFNPAIGKFKCDYCLSEFKEEDLLSSKPRPNIDTKHLNQYDCKSCGAQVVMEDTTTATFCYYCHNPIIIANRLEGEFLPSRMIPFKIDKKVAEKKFVEWAGSKKFLPGEFLDRSTLEKITGIYIPYWWADCHGEIDYEAEGYTIRTWRVGDIEYTERKKYKIIRNGQIDIKNVSELGFDKIEKNLLNGIGPYNESEAISFSMPYLSGFFAEKYNIDKEKVRPSLEDEVSRYYSNLISQSISGYMTVTEMKKNIDLKFDSLNYTLLPTWILTYKYGGKTHIFAVNGQTGKSYGELPLDRKKLLVTSFTIFIVISSLLLLGGGFIW